MPVRKRFNMRINRDLREMVLLKHYSVVAVNTKYIDYNNYFKNVRL